MYPDQTAHLQQSDLGLPFVVGASIINISADNFCCGLTL